MTERRAPAQTSTFPASPPPASTPTPAPPPWRRDQSRHAAAIDAPAAARGDGLGWVTTPEAGAVAGDAVTVYTDVTTGVHGPSLAGHVASLLVDVAALVPLIPIWDTLPATIAGPASAVAALVVLVGHGVAWYIAAGNAHKNAADAARRAAAAGRAGAVGP